MIMRICRHRVWGRGWLLAVALAGALALLGNATVSAQEGPASQVQFDFGEGRLAFGVVAETAKCTVGVPVYMRVFLRNIGADPIRAPVGIGWPRDFELWVGAEEQELAPFLPIGYPTNMAEAYLPAPMGELQPGETVWADHWLALTREQQAAARRGKGVLRVAVRDRREAWPGAQGAGEPAPPIVLQLVPPEGRDAKAYGWLMQHDLIPLPGPDDPGHWLEQQAEARPDYEGQLVAFLEHYPDSVYAPYVHWLVAELVKIGGRERERGPGPAEAEAGNLRLAYHYRPVARSGLPGLADEAWYRLANAQWRLCDYEQSLATYEHLIQEYPDSRWAAQAKEQLPQLRKLAKLLRGR